MNARRSTGLLLFVAAIGMMLAACSSRPEIDVDPSLNADNAGSVYVYRPSSEWAGLAIDFRVNVDGRYVGSLETGGFVQSFIAPGEHVVTVQPHFLSIPDGKPGTATVLAEAGENYYIRFSQHVDEITIIGTSSVLRGHLQLQFVPFETWEQRL